VAGSRARSDTADEVVVYVAVSGDAWVLRLGAVSGHGDPTGFYERLGFTRRGETGTLRRDRTKAFCYMTRPV
jgi:hypothetical protein